MIGTRRRRSRWVVGVVSIGVLLIAGCGTGNANNADGDNSNNSNMDPGRPAVGEIADKGGHLNIRLQQDWRDFNIQTTNDSISQSVVQNAYQTLLAQDDKGQLIPSLATKWEATATEVRFTIGTDSTCSDGTKVTPTVVKNSIQRLIDIKAINNKVNWGPGPYTVTADDAANLVTFTTQSPYGSLPYGFSNVFTANMTGIVCPAGLAPDADLKNKMYGSGPYELVDAQHGAQINFKLRANFKGGANGLTAQTKGIPETVTYRIVPNTATAANMLQTGQLDVAFIAGPDVTRLIADQATSYGISNTSVVWPLTFNEHPGHPTADMTLRRALITAIDPKEYVRVVYQGRAVLSPTVSTPNTQCFDASVTQYAPKPSVEDAKKVLADGGYTLSNGKLMKNGEVIEIDLIYDAALNPASEYIASKWTELGVTVNNDTVPFQEWQTKIVAGAQDVNLVPTFAPGPIFGPTSFRFSGPIPPQGVNFARTNSATLNAAQQKAVGLIGDEACSAWKEYQKLLWTEWHLLPLGAPYVYVFSKGWKVDTAHGANTYPIETRRIKS